MNILKNFIKELQKPMREQNPPCEPQKQIDTTSKIQNHKVTGVTHYKENILSLASVNPQYSLTKKEFAAAKLYNTKVYEYNFKTEKTELIPEPTNPSDSNAIKVMIDGKHVGYIKKGSCKQILNLLKESRIRSINSQIVGGKYKVLWYDKGEGIVSFDQEQTEYGIIISIIE